MLHLPDARVHHGMAKTTIIWTYFVYFLDFVYCLNSISNTFLPKGVASYDDLYVFEEKRLCQKIALKLKQNGEKSFVTS